MLYLVLGLLAIIFFISISRSSSDTQSCANNSNPQAVGKHACNIILSYLREIKMENLTPLIMTELFAFVYYEIDSLLYLRNISARETITHSLLDAYDTLISKVFPTLDLAYAQSSFNERVAEYGALTRANKEKSEIIDRFNLYFSHAKKGVHYKGGEAPLVIGDIRESFEEQKSAHSFYLCHLAPFMKNIVTNFS